MREEPDRPPREEVSANPGPASQAAGAASEQAAAGPATISDPAFETLQALFPGRILAIEAADEDESAEVTSDEATGAAGVQGSESEQDED